MDGTDAIFKKDYDDEELETANIYGKKYCVLFHTNISEQF